MRASPVLLASMVLGACVALAGCATVRPPDQSPLQMQTYQMKGFETDKAVALGAVITVFQDLGYIIQSADLNTGFITASSPAKNNTTLLLALGGVAATGQTRATAFLEQTRPNFTTVRLNFVQNSRRSTEHGQLSEQDTPIVDPQPYKIAFGKIEDAVFVRSGTQPLLAPAEGSPPQAAQSK